MGGSDYADISVVVVFPAGVSEMCVNVTIFEDSVLEIDEHFTLVLSSSDPDVGLSNTELLIIILDINGKVR